VPPDKPHPWQDHNLYRRLSDTHTNTANDKLSSRHVHQGFPVFEHIPCIVSHLSNPELLNTMQIGMLDLLHKWIFHFMKMQEWRDKYNAIWLSVPAYHHLTPKHKSYKEVSQWNGKEMKERSWYLLGVVSKSQWG
jgi:hypothetical protein